MDDLVFCSVAFGDKYIQQQSRLRESIRRIYPRANLLFYTGSLPDGARPFLDSLYGFKPHLVRAALDKGYNRIILLDPAMILVNKIDGFLHYPTIAVKDDSLLYNVVSDKTYEYYGLTRERVKNIKWHLVGGSFYYFDFYNPISHAIFEQWYTAEVSDLFGSQREAASEQLQGHRYDESLMALAMYMNGVEPQAPDQVGYCIGENSIWQKKHFK